MAIQYCVAGVTVINGVMEGSIHFTNAAKDAVLVFLSVRIYEWWSDVIIHRVTPISRVMHCLDLVFTDYQGKSLRFAYSRHNYKC